MQVTEQEIPTIAGVNKTTEKFLLGREKIAVVLLQRTEVQITLRYNEVANWYYSLFLTYAVSVVKVSVFVIAGLWFAQMN